jgi:hypothetical protein
MHRRGVFTLCVVNCRTGLLALLVWCACVCAAQGSRPGLDDLSGLDATLHTNLLAVKACPPEQVDYLGLAFAAEQQLLGKVRTPHYTRTLPLSMGTRAGSNQAGGTVSSFQPPFCKPGLHGACVALVLHCMCTDPPTPCVVFTASHNMQTVQYELLPGGDSVPVTASNRLLYVHLLADWHLNARLGRTAAAFASECCCAQWRGQC